MESSKMIGVRDRIRLVRELLGLTREDLAKLAKVPTAAVRNAEIGHGVIRIVIVDRLCTALRSIDDWATVIILGRR
jgi:transcriptional regulator with XRE-family HTH domain